MWSLNVIIGGALRGICPRWACSILKHRQNERQLTKNRYFSMEPWKLSDIETFGVNMTRIPSMCRPVNNNPSDRKSNQWSEKIDPVKYPRSRHRVGYISSPAPYSDSRVNQIHTLWILNCAGRRKQQRKSDPQSVTAQGLLSLPSLFVSTSLVLFYLCCFFLPRRNTRILKPSTPLRLFNCLPSSSILSNVTHLTSI
jgi:hypothetical protein